MKRNIIPTVLLYSLIFNGLFLQVAEAQLLKKTYTSSIPISDIPYIKIEDPKALNYSMHATMSSAYEEGKGYVLRPGTERDKPCLIIPNYKIETWEKNEIKQEILIEIIPDKNDPKDARKLLDKLSLKIKKKRKNRYLIDGNMNIEKMELINGFFRRDRNTFILEDGSRYNVRQLVIRSFLYIPKKSNVEFDTGYLGVELGDLDGKLIINAEFGYILTGNVKELAANIQHLKAKFENVEQMTLNATYSEISAQEVGHLTIGSLELLDKMPKQTGLFSYDRSQESLSFSNKYKIENVSFLKIKDSANDHFDIGVIKDFEAINSSFSNYFIKKIINNLSLSGRNGDITIYNAATDFENISIDNRISTVELNLENVPNYGLNILNNEKTEIRLSTNLKRLPKDNKWLDNFWKGKEGSGGVIDINCEPCQVIVN